MTNRSKGEQKAVCVVSGLPVENPGSFTGAGRDKKDGQFTEIGLIHRDVRASYLAALEAVYAQKRAIRGGKALSQFAPGEFKATDGWARKRTLELTRGFWQNAQAREEAN